MSQKGVGSAEIFGCPQLTDRLDQCPQGDPIVFVPESQTLGGFPEG